MAAVTLKNVSKAYDSNPPVVRDVSLEIANGEFCVFVGPSGCGKSTLLRMVAGLEDITGGDLYIGEQRVNDLAPSERNVAMVFQNYALYPHMSVEENIAFGMSLAGFDKPTIRERVARIADMLQIERLLVRKPRALSGGQRQRVAIGRALVRDPGVFLFDEPLSNLDAALRTQMRVEIARMHREYGKASTIYVTHDQVEALTLADKIVLLHTGDDVARFGSVAQVGSPMALYNTPANRFVAGFIGSPKMNFIAAEVIAIEPAAVVVKTRRGEVLRAAVSAGALSLGSEVTLGIRPEHVELRDDASADTLSCGVRWVERLGDQTYAYLDGGQAEDLLARLDGTHAVRVDDKVHLHLPPEACHLFDEAGLALKRHGY
ncbi:ATP-binding cassette domain-containing protein [Niveibacterium umoris]|uniref:Multiple sugar transport system ATP-binding protein n=1 Tax=Niveibacterium umoris TaxID=1193620 RepID=A0A840BKI4_9RHOO|nr:multiple sugar transport system ATP-binding protein [Niveibacterium umoris]